MRYGVLVEGVQLRIEVHFIKEIEERLGSELDTLQVVQRSALGWQPRDIRVSQRQYGVQLGPVRRAIEAGKKFGRGIRGRRLLQHLEHLLCKCISRRVSQVSKLSGALLYECWPFRYQGVGDAAVLYILGILDGRLITQ